MKNDMRRLVPLTPSPQPGICPGCGRCGTCGRPFDRPFRGPYTTHPGWHPPPNTIQPIVTY